MIDAPHILVMEDDAHAMRLYLKVLRKAGYEVYPAMTVHSARKALDSHRFNAFICDLKMDTNTGAWLLREYQNQLREHGTHVLIISAHQDLERISHELGIPHYLEKPVSPSVLTTLLDSLINHRPAEA